MPNAYIKTIKEKSTGDIIYPKTTASAVYLTDDSTLDTKLNNMLVAENTGQIETESVDQQATVYYRNIAIIEPSNVASQSYEIGQYLIYQNQLYIATAAIASGDTLAVGTNIESTSVGDEITALNSNKQNKIKFTSFSGTPTAAGNFSYTFTKNIWILAAVSSRTDTIVTPYPSGGGAIGGKATWWFNIHATNAELSPSTYTQTVYIAYIEM